MTRRPAPDWLVAWQTRFSGVLRTPLDRSTGTLRAVTEAYPSDALDDLCDAPNATAAARLAVYHRQYWFRLLTVFQTAFPLTTALLGAWRFNAHAAAFVAAHAPQGWDLDRAPEGFETFLATVEEDTLPREALVEAAGLDASWRGLFRAPNTAPLRLRPEEAARLLEARLVAAPSVVIHHERWPLVALKRSLEGVRGDVPIPLPPKHPRRQGWALIREPGGVRQLPLEPLEAELLALLRDHPVGEALGLLEASCPAELRATLPAQCQRWLAQGVARGFWCGIV